MSARVGITITAQGREPGEATVQVTRLSADERGRRAFKSASIIAAVGMASVFVPIVHFFLPWIMLVVAVVVYARIRGQGAMLQACEVPCAACETTVAIPAQAATWPLQWNCPGCRKRLTLEPMNKAPTAHAQPD